MHHQQHHLNRVSFQDGDGRISAADVQGLLEAQGMLMWPGAAEEMVKEASVTHNGFVTFDEFVVICYG